MPGISITTTDRDEAQAACGRVYFPHRLAVLDEPARFAMSLSATGLGAVSAGLLAYSGEVRIDTGELETGYEVNVPLDGPLMTWTGHAEVCATPSLAAVYRPDGRATLRGWAGGGRLFGLKIERAALESALADLTDRPVRSVVELGPSIDLRSGAGPQWWSLVQAPVALVHDPDGPLSRPIVARPLAHSVIGALLHTAEHPFREALARALPSVRPSIARDAIELMEAEPEHPWTVADLARRVGASSRGLQDAFARHVGTSPMRHLRQVRLRRAHADLLAADPAHRSVADIASAWGFTHLGRFAAAYRQRYGRAPSRTLHDGC